MEYKCSPNCAYFPSGLYSDLDYYIDKDGVKHCNVKPLCYFDDHLITSWTMCKNFKSQKTSNKKLIIFLGSSAAGKDTALNYLIENHDFKPVVSHTTRPMREGEREGRDYYFIQEKDFKALEKEDELVERREYQTCVNGKKDIWYYGIAKTELNSPRFLVTIVDTDGLKSLTEYLGKEKVVSIFISVPAEIRKKRARKRGSFDIEEWNRRALDDELKFNWNKIKKNIDYKINNDGDKTNLYKQIEDILQKENLI